MRNFFSDIDELYLWTAIIFFAFFGLGGLILIASREQSAAMIEIAAAIIVPIFALICGKIAAR